MIEEIEAWLTFNTHLELVGSFHIRGLKRWFQTYCRSSIRQLLNLGFKVAVKMESRYLKLLEDNEVTDRRT